MIPVSGHKRDACGSGCKVYEGLSQASKARFNQTVNLMIKNAVNDATFADYSGLMDDNGSEALKNGLTPEILEALLASND